MTIIKIPILDILMYDVNVFILIRGFCEEDYLPCINPYTVT